MFIDRLLEMRTIVKTSGQIIREESRRRRWGRGGGGRGGQEDLGTYTKGIVDSKLTTATTV